MVNEAGMGDPFFCKYLCPQGVLEGAIPLSLVNSSIRAALGKLFSWKLCVLATVVVLSVVFYRPFCKWLCPLGAFYALFNRVSLLSMHVDENKCVSCGKCARTCHGRGCDQNAEPQRMYPLRQMRDRLPDGGRPLPLRLRWQRSMFQIVSKTDH